MVYHIWQAGKAPWLFMDYDFAIEHGFDFNAYDCVYTLKLDDDSNLEDVYTMLNIDHPRDYNARSLSMSDIVETGGRFWYVDSFGFKEINV